MRWSVIDAPSPLGLCVDGVAQLPDALRAAGLLDGLDDVRSAGSIDVPEREPTRDERTGVLNAGGIVSVAVQLADAIVTTLDARRLPLVLGGDCSILLGPALALRRRGRFGLCFIDGHADYYSPESEPNGEAASMDLAFVTGRGPAQLVDLEARAPLVREEDVVVFGYRDAGAWAEYGSPDVRDTAMRTSDLEEVRRIGPRAAARDVVRIMEERGVEGFWIHLDADVLHDDVMPAVDYRMPDGLTEQELTTVLAVLAGSPLAIGLDVTIYNPALDDVDRSAARTLARTINAALRSAAARAPADETRRAPIPAFDQGPPEGLAAPSVPSNLPHPERKPKLGSSVPPLTGGPSTMATNNPPTGYHTVTPALVVRDAAKAIDFYKRAFGAKELHRMKGPGDSIMHAEIQIGDSRIMLGEENEQWGTKSPLSTNGNPSSLHLYVDNADKAFERAVEAGCSVSYPMEDAFWGDRYGKVKDPFGHDWGIAHHVKDMTDEEMQKAAEEWMSQMAAGQAQ